HPRLPLDIDRRLDVTVGDALLRAFGRKPTPEAPPGAPAHLCFGFVHPDFVGAHARGDLDRLLEAALARLRAPTRHGLPSRASSSGRLSGASEGLASRGSNSMSFRWMRPLRWRKPTKPESGSSRELFPLKASTLAKREVDLPFRRTAKQLPSISTSSSFQSSVRISPRSWWSCAPSASPKSTPSKVPGSTPGRSLANCTAKPVWEAT